MNHQLIKHQPHDGNGTTPRWVYRAENTIIKTKGRHDPCVGIRAVPVGEAMVAIVLADLFLLNQKKQREMMRK